MHWNKTICCIKALCFMGLVLFGCQKKSESTPQEKGVKIGVYYVATNGSDAGNGTLAQPFRTIGKGLAAARPGDTVMVRGGMYTEKVTFPKSGQLDKLITLQAYPNEQPIIDGNGLSATGKEALVTIRNVNYIQLVGFEIRNFKSATPWVDVNGIIVHGSSSHIVIRNNHIHHIEHNVAPENGRSGHAIEVLGNTEVPIQDILIEGNEIHDCRTGYSENLTINGYVDGFIVRKNKVYNGENIGIVAAGGYAANSNPAKNYARNGLIAENEIYHIRGASGPIPAYQEHPGAISIYVDGAQNITVERNWVYDSDRGIGLVSENDHFPTQNCVVRNNVVSNCLLTAIYMGGYLGYTGGGTKHCYVVNNTLVNNNKVTGYFDEIEGEIRLTENCFDNEIRNNIIYARKDGVFIHKYTSSGSGNSIDQNLYYSPEGAHWIWNGVDLTDFDGWKAAAAADAASTHGLNPLFVGLEEEDFHLQATSPAVGSGLVLPEHVIGALDFDGKPRVSAQTVAQGAYQR